MGSQVSQLTSRTDLNPTSSAVRVAEGQAAKMPFRFLDLPPELRNQIYEVVSHQVDEIPLSVFDKGKALDEVPRQGSEGVGHRRILDRLEKTTPQPQRNRFALAQTCRQVRREMRSMLHLPSRLDLQYLMLRSSLKEMKRLTNPSRIGNLQFIRHFEIDLCTLIYFTILPLSHAHRKTSTWEDKWKQLCGATKWSARKAVHLLHSLSNVESITVHASGTFDIMRGHDGLNTFESAGVEMGLQLVFPVTRDALEGALPRLSDITCISERGGERFRKVDGSWQLWYTGQPLPTDCIHPWDRFNNFDWREVQRAGGLITSAMVESLPPVKPNGQPDSQ